MPNTHTAAARVGRPRKPVGSRVKVALRFSAERYAELMKAAHAAGRGVSEEVLTRLEKLAIIEETLAASGSTIPELRDAIFRREHRPLYTAYGAAWWPKADPKGPPEGGFIKMEEPK
jgi:hypothetical protein